MIMRFESSLPVPLIKAAILFHRLIGPLLSRFIRFVDKSVLVSFVPVSVITSLSGDTALIIEVSINSRIKTLLMRCVYQSRKTLVYAVILDVTRNRMLGRSLYKLLNCGIYFQLKPTSR